MSEEKIYTKRCPKCGRAGEDQWSVNDPAIIVRAITAIDEEGGVADTFNVEELPCNVYGVEAEYNCACGGSYTPHGWRALTVVEAEE